MDYQEFVALWKQEKPKYVVICDKNKEKLENMLLKHGVSGNITYRIKDQDSMYKKMISKSKDYESIIDKLGFRIIVKFKSELESLDKAIKEELQNIIVSRDNKVDSAEDNEFGYQSIHYDMKDESTGFIFELQIRTMCQDNWSNLSHTLAYKESAVIPKRILREINALSALFEVADTQFERINEAILKLDIDDDYKLMQFLENKYSLFRKNSIDRTMTKYFISNKNLFYSESEDIENLLEKYIESQTPFIESFFKSEIDNILMTQPEILMVLERLKTSRIKLERNWGEIYPIEILEQIQVYSNERII